MEGGRRMWRQDMAVTPYQSIPEKGERNLATVSQENEKQAQMLAGDLVPRNS